MISRDLKATILEDKCNRDCAIASVKLHGRPVILASVYLDIKKTVVPTWLEDIVQLAKDRKQPLLLGVDSNAHSCLYGPDSNARGEELEDFLLEHALDIENQGNAPTFEVQRGQNLIQTHIDVTLSRDLHFNLENWRVDRAYNASDHNTIRFEAPATKTQKQKIRPWSSADWKVFTEHLRQIDYALPQDISMKKLDRLVKQLYQHIDSALDKACPITTITQKVRSGFWATDKHDKAKAQVTNLYAKAKSSGKAEDWETYKVHDKKFKKMCKQDRNRAWRHYKETLQTEKEMASLARLAQREERREINVLIKQDGTASQPGKDTIDVLTSTHFPAATQPVHVTYNNRRNCSAEMLNDKYTDWINPGLIRKALDGFEKKKSPGPDGIKPLIFEHLPPEFIQALEFAFKAAIHLGYTPKLWKNTKVIFISKPGKDSYDKPKAFRPISLSNYFLKTLERLVGWNMDKALIRNPIHHKQHGFTCGKSTESAISNTTDYIEKFIMKKQHCVGIFLDISAAFDSIRPSHVRRALLDHGGDREMVQWYFNYITHRDIIIDMHGEQSRFSTGIGFPQGGVCSARFWLIAFDYAIKIINKYNIEGNGFADDCSALYGGPRLDHAISRLQKMLDELTAWGRSCGLTFNPEKSVAVVFTRRRKLPLKQLYIDGRPIEYKQEVRYLGITLDSKLHWKKHIDDKIAKAKRFIYQVANITRKNWGPKPKLMRWAFLGIVRPMLCYGSMIWGHRAPFHIARLRRINRMGMNTFASFPKSTPTAAMEIMLDVMPLHLFCQKEAMASKGRLKDITNLEWNGTTNKKTHATSHLRHWETLLQQGGIQLEDLDKCHSVHWNPAFKVNLDSFDGTARHRALSQYNVYTDGSKYNCRVGSGYAIYKGKTLIQTGSFRLPDHATVFQAEITAISKAASDILQRNTEEMKYIKFYVDSQAALKALANPIIKTKSVAEAVQSLETLASKVRRLSLQWIPAHRGLFGNTTADDLAKAGASNNSPASMLQVLKPAAAFKMEIKQFIYKLWKQEWTNDNQYAHAKAFYDGPDSLKARYVYKLARLELGRFARLITGHNNLNAFQTRIGLWGSKKCRLCQISDETFIHWATDCPCLRQLRINHFGDVIPGPDRRWSVRALLDFTYNPTLNLAFEGTWAHGDPLDTADMRTSSETEDSSPSES